MKRKIAMGVLLACATLMPGISSAKGCLKGAAVGAVGGHVAGHHGVVGAAAGCAVGRHMANKKEKQKAADASNGSTAAKPADSPPSNKS